MSLHLPIRVLPSEGPRDAAVLGVASLLPGRDFGGEQSAVWQTAGKALAIKDSDLDFSHVEPAGDAAQQGLRCGDTQR